MLFLSLAGARFGDFGGVAWVMTRFVLQRGPTRVSHKSLSQVTRVSQKGVSQSVSEVCLQEMPTRVPQKGALKECHRSVSV